VDARQLANGRTADVVVKIKNAGCTQIQDRHELFESRQSRWRLRKPVSDQLSFSADAQANALRERDPSGASRRFPPTHAPAGKDF
jgi:hypothetical protein